MGDLRLRRAERRGALEDVLEARVEVLAEGLRRGDFHRDQLRLAAFLGDEAAAMLQSQVRLALPPPFYEDPSDDPTRWLEYLQRWGWDPAQRALVIATRWSCELDETQVQYRARRAIATAIRAGIPREHLAIEVPLFQGSQALEAVEAWIAGVACGDVLELAAAAWEHEPLTYGGSGTLSLVQRLAALLSEEDPLEATRHFQRLIRARLAGRYGSHGRRGLWTKLRRRIGVELLPVVFERPSWRLGPRV